LTDYDTRETHRFEGQPVECYKFTQGDNAWFYTSADRQVILPAAGTFEPAIITRGELDFSHEDTGEMIDFTVPRSDPVAALFIGDLPSTPVGITVYRAHRGDEDATIVIFSGKVIRARFEESQAILTGASLMSVLDRAVPPLGMQTPCNHVLYSQECGVNPTICRDGIVVGTVSGATVTSDDFAARPDQWFRGGRLETSEGETRFIADHVGNTVVLLSALPGLAPLDVVWAYWGCDHLEDTCESKFNNLANHLGWARLPGRNPFDGRID
jgi:uncharacterized phage protein (TIGR02218 family)